MHFVCVGGGGLNFEPGASQVVVGFNRWARSSLVTFHEVKKSGIDRKPRHQLSVAPTNPSSFKAFNAISHIAGPALQRRDAQLEGGNQMHVVNILHSKFEYVKYYICWSIA